MHVLVVVQMFPLLLVVLRRLHTFRNEKNISWHCRLSIPLYSFSNRDGLTSWKSMAFPKTIQSLLFNLFLPRCVGAGGGAAA